MNQPLPWETYPKKVYIPISYEGKVVGFCQPDVADRIVATLNEEEQFRKALKLACYDLVARSGGGSANVEELVQRYLAKAGRPKRGTAMVALLLKDRQDELDLSDEEFAKFCDTFKLSRPELNNIYAGGEIESQQLTPLSRILGMSVDELIAAWQGKEE
ncbi:hypothetical protein ACN4EK_03110 [Pantanalinema rosaneae CENA516]|uniref:hypothetical protein n=1 Tax=Pantanalinema rosaneae TaxID=1620701 RepID=UPI003D6E9C7E